MGERSKTLPERRDAISRARFFLRLARGCPYPEDSVDREPFEAYLEAAIVFGRVAIQRLHRAALDKSNNNPSLRAEVNTWWNSLRGNTSVEFFRNQRNFILKADPPKVGQIVRVPLLGSPPSTPSVKKAEEIYYYEDPNIPATETVERHLNSVEKIVNDAENRFGTSTLLGLWKG